MLELAGAAVPGLHGMQLVCPVSGWYLPAAHTKHSVAINAPVDGVEEHDTALATKTTPAATTEESLKNCTTIDAPHAPECTALRSVEPEAGPKMAAVRVVSAKMATKS